MLQWSSLCKKYQEHTTSIYIYTIYLLKYECQVRDSDPKDPKRERIVQLIDDFRILGANGERILHLRVVGHGYPMGYQVKEMCAALLLAYGQTHIWRQFRISNHCW